MRMIKINWNVFLLPSPFFHTSHRTSSRSNIFLLSTRLPRFYRHFSYNNDVDDENPLNFHVHDPIESSSLTMPIMKWIFINRRSNLEIANSRGTQEASELLKSSDLNTQQDREYVESNEGRSDVDGTIFMPNKKYFDILPNDLYSDEDAGDVSLKTSKEEIENLPHSYEADDPLESAGRRVNSRRFRRDSTNSAGRQKRQNYFVNPYPLTHVPSSYPRYTVDFYFPNEPSYNHQPYQNIFRRDHYSQPQYFAPPPPRQFIPNYPTNYDAPSPSRNPFHPTNTNRLHRPGNLYLPPPPMTRPPPCGSAKWVWIFMNFEAWIWSTILPLFFN